MTIRAAIRFELTDGLRYRYHIAAVITMCRRNSCKSCIQFCSKLFPVAFWKFYLDLGSDVITGIWIPNSNKIVQCWLFGKDISCNMYRLFSVISGNRSEILVVFFIPGPWFEDAFICNVKNQMKVVGFPVLFIPIIFPIHVVEGTRINESTKLYFH